MEKIHKFRKQTSDLCLHTRPTLPIKFNIFQLLEYSIKKAMDIQFSFGDRLRDTPAIVLFRIL